MNIKKIRDKIYKMKNNKLKIRINLGRNKYEYLEGYINDIYPNLFTINTNKGLKSFSYSDVIIKNVIISKFS